MFVKETKIFVIFFSIFALIAFSIGGVDNSLDNTFNPDVSQNFSSKVKGLKPSPSDMIGFEYPDRWEIRNERGFPDNNFSLQLENRADNSLEAKLRFVINPEIKRPGKRNNSLDLYLNQELVERKKFRGKQELKTESFKLEPGQNNLSISIEKCKKRCFSINKQSIVLIAGENITKGDLVFAENWKDLEGEKVMIGDSELHFFNNRSVEKARLSFKGLSGEYEDKKLNIKLEKDKVDAVDLGKHFKLYRSPAFKLYSGENVIKFSSDINFTQYKFLMKNLELNPVVKDELVFGKNWFPEENWYHENPKEYLDMHWMNQNGTIYYYSSQNKTVNKSLSFEIAAFNPPRDLESFVNGEKEKSVTLENSVEDPRRILRIKNAELKPGENKIVLHSEQGCQVPSKVKGNSDERCLSFTIYPSDPKDDLGIITSVLQQAKNLWIKALSVL